jgi:ankyrin repeat protein
MHARLLSDLKNIQQEVLDSKNPYQLSNEEIKNFKIVINTLIYIVENIDDRNSRLRINLNSSNPGSMYIDARMEDYAIIHLEQFKQMKSGKEREEYLIGSVPQYFVECFNEVKEAGKESDKNHTKEFISKMGGLCIDSRIRGPFDYAKTVGKPPTLTGIAEECSRELSGNREYFNLFKKMLVSKWGMKYSGDNKSTKEEEKANGTLDGTKFPLIKNTLSAIAEPDIGFLKLYADIPLDKLPIFIQFVASHEGLIDKARTSIESAEDNYLFNQFIALKGIYEGKIDKEFEKYLEILKPKEIITIWEKYLSVDVFTKISSESQNKLLNLFLNKMKTKPELFEKIIQSKMAGSNLSFIDQFIEMDLSKTVIELLDNFPKIINEKQLYRSTVKEFKCPAISYALLTRSKTDMPQFISSLIYPVEHNKREKHRKFAIALIMEKLKTDKNIDNLLLEVDKQFKNKKYKERGYDLVDVEYTYRDLLVTLIQTHANTDVILNALDYISKTYPHFIQIVNYSVLENSLIHQAAIHNQPLIINKLIAMGLRIPECHEGSPIKLAAKAQNWDAVNALIGIPMERYYNDKEQLMYTLFCAIYHNQHDIALKIFKEYPKNKYDDMSREYVHNNLLSIQYALIHNDTILAEEILKRMPFFHVKNEPSIFIIAAQNTNVTLATLEWILKNNSRAQNSNLFEKHNGKSFFQIARENKHPAFRDLLSTNIPLLAEELTTQINAGKMDIAAVAEIVSEVYFSKGDFKNLLAILQVNYADQKKYEELIWLVVKLCTPEIMKNGDCDTMSFLIEQYPDIVTKTSDKIHMTLLHHAARFDNVEMVKLLVENGANPVAVNSASFLPLMNAAFHNNEKVCSYLMSIDRIKNHTFACNQSLYAAATKGHHNIAVELLKNTVATNIISTHTPEAPSTFSQAIIHNDLELMKMIYEKNPKSINERPIADDKYPTPLIAAVHNKDVKPEIVQWLVEHENLELGTWNGKSAVDYAVETKQFDKLLILVKNKAFTLIETVVMPILNNRKITPSESVKILAGISAEIYKNKGDLFNFIKSFREFYSSNEQEEFFTLLLSHIGELAITNNDVKSILYLQELFPKEFRHVLPDLLTLPFDGGVLLHHAAKLGNTKAVEAIIKAEANIAPKNADDQTPLLIAIAEKKWDVVKQLIDAKALSEPEKIFYKLVQSSDDENASKLALELLKAADIKGVYNERDTNMEGNPTLLALHQAILANNIELAEAILAKFGNINATATPDGATPLDIAVRNVNVSTNTLTWLLKQKDCNFMHQFNDRTTLEVLQTLHPMRLNKLLKDEAIRSLLMTQYKEVSKDFKAIINYIPLIRALGLLNNPVDDDGNTLLHMACKSNDNNLVKELIKAGADRSIKNKAGETPASIAAETKAWKAIDQLAVTESDNEPEKEDTANLGYALLDAVIDNKHALAMKLLKAGANANVVYEDDNILPLQHALIHNDIRLADEIYKRHPKTQSKENPIPLIIAIVDNKQVRPETIKWIMARESVPLLTVTHQGKSVLEMAFNNQHLGVLHLIRNDTEMLIKQLNTDDPDVFFEALNKLYLLAHDSKEKDKYELLGNIRKAALKSFKAIIAQQPNEAAKNQWLDVAEKQAIFKDYRFTSKYNLFQKVKSRFADTSTLKEIKAMRKK